MGFLDKKNFIRCMECGILHHKFYDCFTDPLGLKKQDAQARAAPEEILDLKPEWVTGFDLGGVHIERLIGGCRVSMVLPDGTAVSEEFTGPEFYEVMYRNMNPKSHEGIIFFAVAAWAFVCVVIASSL